jgi:predicted AAA+ superfamily ATPase
VRGDEDTVSKMFRIISLSDKPTHQLFTGHRGCGKSTELLRLQQRLQRAGFYVVYFAVDEDLDSNDLIYTDLLLSIARRVIAQTSKDEIDLGDALRTVETWFSEVVYQEDEWEPVGR